MPPRRAFLGMFILWGIAVRLNDRPGLPARRLFMFLLRFDVSPKATRFVFFCVKSGF